MKLIYSFAIVFLFFSCKNETQKATEITPELVEKIVPEKGVNEEWAKFETAVGQLPSVVGLFDSADLNARLKQLMGEEYEILKRDWNEETPIFIEDRILFATGCKKDFCANNLYLLYLDILDNNINVVNFKDQITRSYEERAIIGLPAQLLEKFETIRKSQGL